MPDHSHHIAAFVTPHGYGHAARACAVLLAIRELAPDVHFEIFTRSPQWFFDMSLGGGFTYHDLLSDIGLVQSTAMDENLPETIRRLQAMLPFDEALLDALASQLLATGCAWVLCDISPLGIAAAHRAGLPAILEENFTWDWIYASYVNEEPRFGDFIAYLDTIFRSADIHVQTEPTCSLHLHADLRVNPVARKPRATSQETRAQLGIDPDTPLILLTMGGIGAQYPFLQQMRAMEEMIFLVPGGDTKAVRQDSLLLLPHHTDLYHPDLVEASNGVVGKLGYSTLAETYHAGLPYAFIPRPSFRESQVMGDFVLSHMNGIQISESQFNSGEWLRLMPDLLRIPRQRPHTPNGADQIAQYLMQKLT